MSSRPALAPGFAVVTGAASGLGWELSAALLREGWQVARVDLPAALATRAAGEEREAAAAGSFPLDVRDAAGWRSLLAVLRADWPRIDMLVNAAGVGATAEVGGLPEEQWRRVLDTNLLGTALGCETFLPWLREHPGRSHLVNVASIAAFLSLPSLAAYSASKAGVVALSEAIVAECPRGRPGVTVVCPGFFRSGLLDTWHFASALHEREAQRRMAASGWDSARVAGRVLRAVRSGHRYVVVGAEARWMWRLKRLAPRVTTALVRGLYRRLTR